MIVSCEKCTKNYNIQDDLITEKGRLLQCGSCNHKWFYKLPPQKTSSKKPTITDLKNEKTIIDEKEKIIEEIVKSSAPIEKKVIHKEEKKTISKNIKKINKGPSLIKRFIVFIISIIALLILIDTFKFQLEEYIPGIDMILNNLYETLKDLFLFLKDLIK